MKAIKIITMLLIATTLNTAFAEAASSDKFILLMQSLFGSLFGGGNDPFIAIITVLNASALSVAGILTAYILLAGTMGTAHDGEMLGKKFSSMWMPIKIAVGAALVIPAFNGYCAMQMLTAEVIKIGVGMGGKAATEFMSSQSLSNVASAGLVSVEPKNLAYNLFASYSCLNLLDQETKNTTLFSDVKLGATVEDGVKNTIYYFGNKSGSSGIANDVCGKLEVSKWEVPPVGQLASGLVRASEAVSRMQTITAENISQTNTLMSKMNSLSAKMISSGVAINPSEIDAAANAFSSAVNSKAAATVKSVDEFSDLKKNIEQDGFFFLGAYYVKLSRMIDITNNAVTSVPVASGVSNFNVPLLQDKWQPVYQNIAKTVGKSGNGSMNFGVSNNIGGNEKGWLSTIKDSIMGGFDPQPILKKAFSSGSTLIFNDKENIMLKIQRIGKWSLALAGGGFAAVGVAMATVGNAPGIGLFLALAMGMIVMPLLVFGVVAAYVIPYTPLLIWLGCVFSYLIKCVESIIGIVLWAVLIISEGGHDILGHASTGFKQLLVLLFKPILMVVGFAVSVVVMEVYGQMISLVFADTWNLAQDDANFLSYIIGLVAAPFIYVMLARTVINECFSLIHKIPDGILRLMGVDSDATSHAQKSAASVAGVAAGAGAAGAALANGIQQAVNQKQLKDSLDENGGDFNKNRDGQAVKDISQENTSNNNDNGDSESKSFSDMKNRKSQDNESNSKESQSQKTPELDKQFGSGANDFMMKIAKDLGGDKASKFMDGLDSKLQKLTASMGSVEAAKLDLSNSMRLSEHDDATEMLERFEMQYGSELDEIISNQSEKQDSEIKEEKPLIESEIKPEDNNKNEGEFK